jgi:SAUR family protein
MAPWTKKANAKALPSCVPSVREDRKKIPKGYLPLVLVHDEEGGAETRVLVRVKDLKEPCMAALLELAEQQFGYGQQGVLRVPCDAQRFEHVVNMARKCKTHDQMNDHCCET